MVDLLNSEKPTIENRPSEESRDVSFESSAEKQQLALEENRAQDLQVEAMQRQAETIAPEKTFEVPKLAIGKDQLLVEIEKVLSKRLVEEDVFKKYVPDDRKKAFAAKGEAVAAKIREAILRKKTIGKSWLDKEVRSWLQMIPNATWEYLEQEVRVIVEEVTEYLRLREKNRENVL